MKNIVRLLVQKKYNSLSDLKLKDVSMKKILLFWVQALYRDFLDRKAEEGGALVFSC